MPRGRSSTPSHDSHPRSGIASLNRSTRGQVAPLRSPRLLAPIPDMHERIPEQRMRSHNALGQPKHPQCRPQPKCEYAVRWRLGNGAQACTCGHARPSFEYPSGSSGRFPRPTVVYVNAVLRLARPGQRSRYAEAAGQGLTRHTTSDWSIVPLGPPTRQSKQCPFLASLVTPLLGGIEQDLKQDPAACG